MIDIHSLVHITKIPNFEVVKTNTLAAIDSMSRYSIEGFGQKLCNTDWHISPEINRPYWSIISLEINRHNQLLKEKLNLHSVNTGKVWHQQYETGDYHSWHTHNGSIYSNVMYIELSDDSPKTSFSYMGDEYTVDVNEGDIITFPSFLAHGSKPNTGARKTVIGFNTDIEDSREF